MANNRRDFIKNSLFASLALALPTVTKVPEKAVNTQIEENVLRVNGIERMRIYSSGNIGIGTIHPDYDLKLIV